jgi:hypothetical protein
MPKDLTVNAPNRPGTFDALRDATAGAGVAIEGLCAFATMGQKTFHLLTSDEQAPAARRAIQDAGLEVRLEREVFVLPVTGGSSAMSEVARRLAQAEVSIDLLYLAPGDRLVIGVDSIDRAQTALIGFGS